jgi:hypothetical protein
MRYIDERLVELQVPYLHLRVCTRELFYSQAWPWYFYNNKKVISRIIRGWKCFTRQALFNEHAAALQFPAYFGENWPAFDECLNDLEWFPADAYILFISDADKLLAYDNREFTTFMKIITKTIREWVTGREYDEFPNPPTPFHVVLHSPQDASDSFMVRLAQAGIAASEIDIVRLQT